MRVPLSVFTVVRHPEVWFGRIDYREALRLIEHALALVVDDAIVVGLDAQDLIQVADHECRF
jgi:hypothetical protein